MAYPRVELGGIPIAIQAGALSQEYVPLGDAVPRRRSRGALVKFRQWDLRYAISVSGSGWIGPGLAGLNYDNPLELRCTAPMELWTDALTTELPTQVRPDHAPWAHADVDGRLLRTPLAFDAGVVTLTAVPGATRYLVQWMPMFTVSLPRPSSALDQGARSASWSFTAEEV